MVSVAQVQDHRFVCDLKETPLVIPVDVAFLKVDDHVSYFKWSNSVITWKQR